MTDCQKLFSGISKAAWGYFFLYFNININNVSILPGFVGYLLFLSAIRLLKEALHAGTSAQYVLFDYNGPLVKTTF